MKKNESTGIIRFQSSETVARIHSDVAVTVAVTVTVNVAVSYHPPLSNPIQSNPIQSNHI